MDSDGLDFLQGGGDLGRLTRAKDWAATPIGAPAGWPQSLKVTIRLMLEARFPMVIWWGRELVQFYNDAFRDRIGPEVHPVALGARAADVWAELWEIVGPLIDQVMDGRGAVWFEDHRIPMTRHGRFEDSYWTFGYSPIDDAAAPNGVGGILVICHETTETVKARQESEQRYRQLFEAIDAGFCTIEVLFDAAGEATDYRYLSVNPAFERHTGLRDAVGRRIRELAPEPGLHAIDTYGRIVRTRRPERFERWSEVFGRWFDIYAFPNGDPRDNQVAILFNDITPRKQADAALRRNEARLRTVIEVGRLATWEWNMESGAIAWSDEHFRIEGYAVGEVTPSYDVWVDRIHPEDRQATEAALLSAKASGEDYVHEFRFLLPDGTVRWASARGRFFHDEAGSAIRMVGAMVETTERREWEETQKVLVAELQHRTRNLIAVIRSVASRTLRASRTLPDFERCFEDRLASLSRVQGLLSRSDRTPITIGTLIRMELDAIGSASVQDRIRIEGRDLPLRNGVVQTLALAIHELATNAVKHGALAAAGGRLHVSWNLHEKAPDGAPEAPRLVIEWLEDGLDGRAEAAGTAAGGYGRELIERALPYSLGARTSYALGRDRLRCCIDLPYQRRDAKEVSG
jgi:PAS domain S-box-containing protein